MGFADADIGRVGTMKASMWSISKAEELIERFKFELRGWLPEYVK